jgi:hypothetical protein
MNLTTVHNSFTICFLFINIFINLTLPENLTAVLITFERSLFLLVKHQWIYSGKVLMKALFFEYISFLFSLFLFFFSTWYDGLILPRNIIDLFLQGAKKKAFTRSILLQNHSVIVTCWFTIYTRITESLAADISRFYDLILV